MKNIIYSTFFIIISILNTNAQANDPIIDSYFEMQESEYPLTLIHGPIDGSFGTIKHGNLFFVNGFNEKIDSYENHAVLYDYKLDLYSSFGHNSSDPSFGNMVISVFLENVDSHPEKEVLIIYESGGRTHFSPNGGYAGIKAQYKTRVFNFQAMKYFNVINEYQIIGDLLTINLPILTGTMEEEILIGRENSLDKLMDVVGVTYSALQVKTRLKLLKDQGFLGSNYSE